MLGSSLAYFWRHPQRVGAALSDPLEAWITFQDRYAERRERRKPACNYAAEADWERKLHERLGRPWPCDHASEFWTLWPQVIEELRAQGVQAGPQSFHSWNDGDAGFVRAIWCLMRHLRPRTVVETGVAHGFTSRFMLEALERQEVGHLWSIDRPPLDPVWQAQVGMAVPDRLKPRWTYVSGSSRRRLPALLSQIGEVDLFVHDSLHSERNVRFELDQVWPLLRPGGAIVVDDIDANWAFHSFMQDQLGYPAFVCEAEPVHPDTRRFNNKGLFGIILKQAA